MAWSGGPSGTPGPCSPPPVLSGAGGGSCPGATVGFDGRLGGDVPRPCGVAPTVAAIAAWVAGRSDNDASATPAPVAPRAGLPARSRADAACRRGRRVAALALSFAGAGVRLVLARGCAPPGGAGGVGGVGVAVACAGAALWPAAWTVACAAPPSAVALARVAGAGSGADFVSLVPPAAGAGLFAVSVEPGAAGAVPVPVPGCVLPASGGVAAGGAGEVGGVGAVESPVVGAVGVVVDESPVPVPPGVTGVVAGSAG
jgi:hypothetical protein